MTGARVPGTPSLLRAINDRAALDLLLEHGPLTRARIGELTGLSKVTASQLVERLEERELVARVGEIAGGRGPNAQLYAIVPSCAYVVGVEVGPAGVVAASADVTGQVAARVAVSTDDAEDPLGRVHTAIMEAMKQADASWDRVRRIVLGTPGLVDPATGDISFAVDLPRWHHGLRAALAGELDRPVRFENDVNLAAIAEARFGAARAVPDFALLWIGRGVGLAVVLGGRLHRGSTGAAGEIGYLYTPGGPPPDYGRTGNPRSLTPAFQQTVNDKAVRALARTRGIRAATAAEAVAVAVEGGTSGGALLDELARRLALGLVAVCAVLDPALVVLAGELGRSGGDRLAERVQQQVARLAPVTPRVVASEVAGEPVLQGALLSALDEARDEVFAGGSR